MQSRKAFLLIVLCLSFLVGFGYADASEISLNKLRELSINTTTLL
jgi:hypothetical protein